MWVNKSKCQLVLYKVLGEFIYFYQTLQTKLYIEYILISSIFYIKDNKDNDDIYWFRGCHFGKHKIFRGQFPE